VVGTGDLNLWQRRVREMRAVNDPGAACARRRAARRPPAERDNQGGAGDGRRDDRHGQKPQPRLASHG
jgi:hypothetical protein